LKPRSTHRNLIPGRVGLALVALLSASALPLGAQEQNKEREKGKEPARQAPAPQRPVAQEQAPPAQHPAAPAQRPPAPAQAPAQRPAAPVQAPGQAPAQHPGMPAQAPGQRPGMGAQAPVQRPGMPVQAPGQRPGMGAQAPVQHPGMPAQAPGQRPGMGVQAPGQRPGMAQNPGMGNQPGRAPAPFHPGPPLTVVRTRDGGEIHRAPGGAIREVHTPNGAVIHYAPDGMRHVEVVRPDGRVVFANGNGHGGFVQRPLMFHNQPLVQRTYVEHGVAYTRVYRPYAYGGVTYNVYMPSHYYRPAYYSYAYRPWGEPVRYRWGWEARPWYGYYHGYYTPYPIYTSPIFWLTDFMVAATLQAAYQSRIDNAQPVAAPYGSYDPGGMSPEVKQAIADEVRRQVDQERAEQAALSQPGYTVPASAPPPMFAGNVSRIFLVASGTVAYAGGQERLLPEGDVLQLQGAPPPGSTYADVVVLSSRDPAVPNGSTVSVSLQDLQEMQNHMRASIDQGLGDLQSRQGQDGLPPLPAQAAGTSDAPFANAIQPDPNAAGELSQVAQDANSSGQSVLSQAVQAPPAPAQTVSLGMSADQVHGILGSPKETAIIGNKRIEVFQDFKVTFFNGRVSDIQ